MSVPQLDANGGIYQLTWADEHIGIRVDRLSEDSKYNVTGEIRVRTSLPGVHEHLHQARLNLTSTAARRTLAGHLKEQLQDVDWHGMVEQACVIVLERYREGEPLIRLSEHSISEHVLFRLDPLLQEKQPTVFYGQGDTGKSFEAVYSSVLIASGLQDNGFTPEPGNVLYLDYETDEDTLWSRVEMVANGLNIPFPANFHYRYCTQLLAGDIETIQRHVLEKAINFIVIDSATPAVGEPESAQMTTEYFRALRSLRVTTLTIAHLTKNGKEEAPFGSIFWRNLPRSTFRINASHDTGTTNFTLGLKHTKSNNGIRLKDIGMELTFGDKAVKFEKVDVRDVPELAQTLTLRERIEAVVAGGKRNVAYIAEELGETMDKVRVTLNRYRDKAFIKIDDEWGLASHEKTCLAFPRNTVTP